MKFHPHAIALAAAVALGACSHTPPPSAALLEARSAVRTAEADPEVLARAPLALKKAADSLQRANLMHAQGEAIASVDSAAHVALQQARTASALARAQAHEDAIRMAETERERARAEVRTLEAQRAQVQARVASQQAQQAETRAAGAENRAAGAEAQAAAAQMRAGAAEQQAEALRRQLADLQAQQTDRGTLVTLGDLLFEFDRAEVKPAARGELMKLADFLKAYPDRRVLIEGHTDNVGADSYNEQLSRRRAEAVAQALVALGVESPRVTVVGHGKQYPVAANTSDTNRALNRRVEVYLSNNDQPVRPRG